MAGAQEVVLCATVGRILPVTITPKPHLVADVQARTASALIDLEIYDPCDFLLIGCSANDTSPFSQVESAADRPST
jgi:hypothetical protein